MKKYTFATEYQTAVSVEKRKMDFYNAGSQTSRASRDLLSVCVVRRKHGGRGRKSQGEHCERVEASRHRALIGGKQWRLASCFLFLVVFFVFVFAMLVRSEFRRGGDGLLVFSLIMVQTNGSLFAA
ncbi:hypothetical protein ISCGN_009891 [Ixodes scapularis]